MLLISALVISAWTVKITFFASSDVVDALIENIDGEVVANDKTNEFSQQKIITLAPHVVEMLFDIGVGDRIIGTTEHSDYPAQALEIPLLGNYARLKIEDILALQPDLIIAWRTGNPSDDLERLEQLGLKVVYSDPRYLSDVSKELRLFGKLTGANELAEQKASQFESRLNALRERYQDKSNINVFYELWSKPLTTIAQQAWPQQHLEVCGANNIFVDLVNDYPQINIEQIIINDPQLIIQPMSNAEPNPDAIDWQKFKQVKAAKYQQQLKPNSDILHRMSFRLLDELEQLCIDIDKSRDFYHNLSSATQN